MPDVEWNSSIFAGAFDWKKTGGEEWSEPWGGSEPQWFGSLYPRLHRFIPAPAVLEIAPGFGRWTKFLLPACQSYLGIDLSGECVAACRERFAGAEHARFAQNDGLSLAEARDGHFDFVFSFDALVHVEIEVMEHYILQILRKLTPTGVAFLHHSNFAALPAGTAKRGERGVSVSAELVAAIVRRGGGKVLIQERINWGAPYTELLDCMTLLARPDHPAAAPAIDLRNGRFMPEAEIIRDVQAMYCTVPRS